MVYYHGIPQYHGDGDSTNDRVPEWRWVVDVGVHGRFTPHKVGFAWTSIGSACAADHLGRVTHGRLENAVCWSALRMVLLSGRSFGLMRDMQKCEDGRAVCLFHTTPQ